MINISQLEEILPKIEEKQAGGFCFEIRHKILTIPRDIYFEAVRKKEKPLSEAGAQYLVENYLDWKDEEGLPGMIRINDNQEEDQIELDAAIRYIVNCESSPPEQ